MLSRSVPRLSWCVPGGQVGLLGELLKQWFFCDLGWRKYLQHDHEQAALAPESRKSSPLTEAKISFHVQIKLLLTHIPSQLNPVQKLWPSSLRSIFILFPRSYVGLSKLSFPLRALDQTFLLSHLPQSVFSPQCVGPTKDMTRQMNVVMCLNPSNPVLSTGKPSESYRFLAWLTLQQCYIPQDTTAHHNHQTTPSHYHYTADTETASTCDARSTQIFTDKQ